MLRKVSGQVLADLRHVAAPAQVEKIEVRQFGVAGGEAVRVLAAVMNAERPVPLAPRRVHRQDEPLVVRRGDHRVGALGVQIDRLAEMAHVAVDGNGAGAGLGLDAGDEPLDDRRHLAKLRRDLFRRRLPCRGTVPGRAGRARG